MNRKYDAKRVNKFNLILILIFSVVLVAQAFGLSGTELLLALQVSLHF